MKRRYKHYRSSGSKINPWIIAGIVVGGVLLLTVLVGNLLTLWLDDETYQRLTEGDPEEAQQEEPLIPNRIPPINAFPWPIDGRLQDAMDLPAVSVTMNTPGGSLLYTSEASKLLGAVSLSKTPLKDTVQELSGFSPYISGVFYSQGLYYTDPDIRYAEAAREGALLREFLRAGGEDVILLNLPFDRVSLQEITDYVLALRRDADGSVGVAIPTAVLEREDGWQIYGALQSVCDFCLLDTRTASLSPAELLVRFDYQIKQYGLRLLLCETQTELVTYLSEQLYGNYQVIEEERAETEP